jgi:hypothetical protein
MWRAQLSSMVSDVGDELKCIPVKIWFSDNAQSLPPQPPDIVTLGAPSRPTPGPDATTPGAPFVLCLNSTLPPSPGYPGRYPPAPVTWLIPDNALPLSALGPLMTTPDRACLQAPMLLPLGAPVAPRPYGPNSAAPLRARTIVNFVISPLLDVLYVLETARKIYLMVGARV